jgi:AAA ATPase domain
MPTYVYVDNYRGFANAVIPLRQVNFLVGENSTGKSSFLDLLEVFSNTSFWVMEPTFPAFGAQPKHFLDLVSAASRSKVAFCIGAVQFTKDPKSPAFGMLVTYANLDGRPVPHRISIVRGSTVSTVDGALWRTTEKYRFRRRNCEATAELADDMARFRKLVAAHKASAGFADTSGPSTPSRLPIFMRFEEMLFGGEAFVGRQQNVPRPFRTPLIELAPIRTKARRTYDEPQTEFSREGDHTPYVIKRRLASKNLAASFQAFLDQAGQSSGLFKSIRIKPYGKGPQAPFEIRIMLGETALGIGNVGYGVSQALPVLVEMFVRPQGTAFTIQQPEVHLHPRAQATFGDQIATLARSQKKVFFVETHSDFTIDRFRLNVREHGAIPSQVLFFERGEQGNSAAAIPILENGDLSANQPDAYRSFFLNESLRVLS